MLSQFTSIANRILFLAAFVLAIVAALEKIANFFGFTLLLIRGYQPSRLLELSAVALLFVFALQLREIRDQGKGSPATQRGGTPAPNP